MREEEVNGQIQLVRQAPGQTGEICFGGMLATCYWKHDELTAEKWVQTDNGLLLIIEFNLTLKQHSWRSWVALTGR